MAEHKSDKKPEKGHDKGHDKGKEKPKEGGGGGGSVLPELLIFLLVLLLLAPIFQWIFSTGLFSWIFGGAANSPFGTFFGFGGDASSGLGGGGSTAPMPESVRSFLSTVKLVATLVTMAGLAIAAYAFMSLHTIMEGETGKLGLTMTWEKERTEKNVRWERVLEYMRSLNSSDWKMAILEADNILDEIVERMGYKGETLGERMKHIEARDFPYLEEVWKAHKLRNAIAHRGGPDYTLTRASAEQTINVYQRVFKELGYL